MKNINIDHKILAKHFNKTIQAMHQLKQKWVKEKKGLWIIYVKAYTLDTIPNEIKEEYYEYF